MQQVYKDTLGRGWRVMLFEHPTKSCYKGGCKNQAILEMVRIFTGVTRRELLCGRCFNERFRSWGLIKV